ncbi:hypothetical protein [Legionella anisa]|uniref:hypothetical protein n=1 Tax=Legionella anisa TaxID=28082 RepID=UPI00034B398C|nr:hypothetical protein [Legionella anisa]
MSNAVNIVTDFKENEVISKIIYGNLKNLMSQSLGVMKQNLLLSMQKTIPLKFLAVLKAIYLEHYAESLPFGSTKNSVVKDWVENSL